MIFTQLSKNLVRKFFETLAYILGTTKLGGIVFEKMVEQCMEQTQTVTYHGLKMHFSVPNQINRFRVKTFATKEPETLEWIDKLPEKCVLWDIGANVGLYTV